MILVCGSNNSNQLGEKPDSVNSNGNPFIFPPKNLNIDPASILSFSVLREHAVIIYKDGTMQGIGFNDDCRISSTLPKTTLKEFTTFTISDSKGRPLIPISACTGFSYTLYHVKSSLKSVTSQLYFVHKQINDGTPFFLNINGRIPQSIYGGFNYAAAIDSEGCVLLFYPGYLIMHSSEEIESFHLPNGEKAANLACCFQKILALSLGGHVYESNVQLGRKLSFHLVDELRENEFVNLSGIFNHVFAVSRDGRVFARGENKFGCLGLGPQEEVPEVNKFTLVEKLKSFKIDAAFAGCFHSFFKTDDGKIISCGMNDNGELCLEGTKVDEMVGDYPVETEIKSGATFCIAGYGLSVIFVGCEPPPNIPNKAIENPNKPVEKPKQAPKETPKSDKKVVAKKKKPTFQQDLQIIECEEIDNFRDKKLIGKGGQSCVYRIFDDKFYALKEFEVGTNMSENVENMKRLLQEYQAINIINHPNIIKTYGICFGDEKHPPSILLEFCPDNLANSINLLFNWQLVTTVYEICLAMSEIHKIHLIHRDLKPENILLDSIKHVKISDFGVSRMSQKSNEDDEEEDDDNDEEKESMTFGVGTLKFMAPEILNEEKHYDNKVDVYSFGVVLFFILTKGQYPEISIGEVALGKKAKIPDEINEFSKQLINRCWSMDPKERPSFSEIIDEIKRNDFRLVNGINDDIFKIKLFLGL